MSDNIGCVGCDIKHCPFTFHIENPSIVDIPRHGYLGSTSLACRAVARPHIKLEICIKHKYHKNYTHNCSHNYFVTLTSTVSQHANIFDKKINHISSFSILLGPFLQKFENALLFLKLYKIAYILYTYCICCVLSLISTAFNYIKLF